MSFLSQLNDQQRAEVEAHYAERYAADRNSQLSTTQQQLHAAQQQAAIQLQHMQQLQKQLDEHKQSIAQPVVLDPSPRSFRLHEHCAVWGLVWTRRMACHDAEV